MTADRTLFDSGEGADRRDHGIASAQARIGADQDRQVIDQAIRHLAGTGRVWSVDELRSLLPVVDGQLLGARVLTAARAGTIERVGTTTVRHAAGHARRVATWRGTGQPPPDTPARPQAGGPARCSSGYLVAADGTCCPLHEQASCETCGQPVSTGQRRHPMCGGEAE